MNHIIHRHSSSILLQGRILIGFISAVLAVALANAAAANSIELTDYYETETVGASWDYRVLDREGQTVGSLSEEIIEEESTGFFRSELVSTFGDMIGTATFWKRFNAAGEELVAAFDFETQFDGMVIDSSSTDFGDPTENFSSLSLGEEARISTAFTEVSQGFSGEQQRSGSTEIKVTFEAFEEVAVPAGTFDTVRLKYIETLTYDDDPQNPVVDTQIHWYAAGIGRVKKEFPESDPEDVHYRDELIAYSLPDDPQDPEESFSGWIASHDLTEGEEAPDANPSGDGIANAMKYALGLDPTVATRAQLPAEDLFEAGDEQQYLAIKVDLNETAQDAAVSVEFSSDIKNWEGAPEDVTVIEETDTVLHVRDNQPVSSTAERFARLQVELAE